jgi:hypothetical protein
MRKALPPTSGRMTTFVSNASTPACAFGDRAIDILQAHRPHAGWRCEATCQKLIYAQLARRFGNCAWLRGVLGNFERRLLDEPELLRGGGGELSLGSRRGRPSREA